MNIPLHQVIIRPIMTEKAILMDGVYTFYVHKNADKIQIRKAVETLFSVKVSSVNTLNQKPLIRTFGRKKGVQKGYKKAYIRVSEGVINFSSL